MVPSCVITVIVDGERLTCSGFSLGKTIRLGRFEFIADLARFEFESGTVSFCFSFLFFSFLFSLFRLENHVCLSRGVQVAGAA
jgi:hypothetical protein